MKKLDSGKWEKISAGDIFHRVLLFAVCGLIVLGVYCVMMIPLYFVSRGLFTQNDGEPVSAFRKYFFYIVYSVLYIIPLFFVYFIRNNELKRQMLKITEDKPSLKEALVRFTRETGKYDLIIYAVYSLVCMITFSESPKYILAYIYVQQLFFYMIPIPRIVGYIFAMLVFLVQYYVCLAIAARYWDKHRLHRKK